MQLGGLCLLTNIKLHTPMYTGLAKFLKMTITEIAKTNYSHALEGMGMRN
jgi:hypothetical protein